MGISIVMPAFNAGPYIAEAIGSVLAQTGTDWELLIIDDHSSDDTAAIAGSVADDRIRLLRPPEHLGAAGARNLGTAHARYDWLCYFDADDRLLPGALATLLAGARTAPEAGVVYGNYVRINAKGERFGTRRYLSRLRRPNGDVLREFLVQNRMVNGGLALVRKALVDAVGGWNPQLKSSNDWALWALLATQAPFHYLPGVIALEYRELPTGITQSVGTSFERYLPALDFVFSHPLLTSRLPAKERGQLRQQREAHVYTLLAIKNLRQRQFRTAATYLLQALQRDWRRSPRALAQFSLAALDAVF